VSYADAADDSVNRFERERKMVMKKWGWLVQYAVTIALALGFGALLSQIPVFHEATLGSAKLRASQCVQFLGFGGALIVLWRFGQRLAGELPTLWPKMNFLRPVIIPLTTLIVITASHPVCGQILGPFLGKTAKGVYNWLFVMGIVSAALWVVLSWYNKAAPLLQAEELKTEESSQGPSALPMGSSHPRYLSPAPEESV
jgi:hypothetical protein